MVSDALSWTENPCIEPRRHR